VKVQRHVQAVMNVRRRGGEQLLVEYEHPLGNRISDHPRRHSHGGFLPWTVGQTPLRIRSLLAMSAQQAWAGNTLIGK
jgi:hypothetical protein